jgi:hypothetical protein
VDAELTLRALGSNNEILLKMFPIACDAWTHSDESGCPELQRPRNLLGGHQAHDNV